MDRERLAMWIVVAALVSMTLVGIAVVDAAAVLAGPSIGGVALP